MTLWFIIWLQQGKHSAHSKYITTHIFDDWWSQPTNFRGIRNEKQNYSDWSFIAKVRFCSIQSAFFFFFFFVFYPTLQLIKLCQNQQFLWIKLRVVGFFFIFFCEYTNLCKQNYFQETPDFSKSPALFFNRNFVRKQETNCVILSITSLTQEKIMFSHIEQPFMVKQMLFFCVYF